MAVTTGVSHVYCHRADPEKSQICLRSVTQTQLQWDHWICCLCAVCRMLSLDIWCASWSQSEQRRAQTVPCTLPSTSLTLIMLPSDIPAQSLSNGGRRFQREKTLSWIENWEIIFKILILYFSSEMRILVSEISSSIISSCWCETSQSTSLDLSHLEVTVTETMSMLTWCWTEYQPCWTMRMLLSQ